MTPSSISTLLTLALEVETTMVDGEVRGPVREMSASDPIWRGSFAEGEMITLMQSLRNHWKLVALSHAREDFAAIAKKEQPHMANHKGAEHHHKAAEHHELAATHHEEAAKLHEAGDHEKAAYHAHVAHGHDLHATYHAEEAAKYHADQHGKN
jgi:hypothetical protein